MSALLSVKDLSVSLGGKTLVDKISFDVAPGEVLSIVGESGSGKSMTAKALMGLLPPKASATGTAMFDGANLLARDTQTLRGTGIGLIFQPRYIDFIFSLSEIYFFNYNLSVGNTKA